MKICSYSVFADTFPNPTLVNEDSTKYNDAIYLLLFSVITVPFTTGTPVSIACNSNHPDLDFGCLSPTTCQMHASQ